MDKQKNKKQLKITILTISVILIMVLIFKMSSQVAEESNELSKGVTKVVAKVMEIASIKSHIDIGRLNHLVRKLSHFSIYLVMGLLVKSLLRKMGVYGFKSFILALVICVLYAISDEVHQLYVPGRGGQVRDVLIDSSGAIVGILINSMLYQINYRKNT